MQTPILLNELNAKGCSHDQLIQMATAIDSKIKQCVDISKTHGTYLRFDSMHFSKISEVENYEVPDTCIA